MINIYCMFVIIMISRRKPLVILQENALQFAGAVPIPGYRQYAITEDGVVYRLWGRVAVDPMLPVATFLGNAKGDGSGHIFVGVRYKDSVDVGGDVCDVPCFPVPVHRLVALTFLGAPPEGKPWVKHKDGNKTNNHYSNLEWSSISDSIQRAHDAGLIIRPRGAGHHRHGVKASASTRAVMSAKKIGENHPKFKGWYELDGKRYCSIREAVIDTGKSRKEVQAMAGFFLVGSSCSVPDRVVSFKAVTDPKCF